MRRQRITWGRAFGFSALAVGAPWAICAAIAVLLTVLPGDVDGFPAFVLLISPAAAAVGILVGGLLAFAWPPRTRTGAAGQTLAACVLAIGAVALAIGVIVAPGSRSLGALLLSVYAFAYASGIFLVGGGGIWAVAGGIVAARVLPGRHARPPGWVPYAWILFGALGAIGSVIYAVTAPAPDVSPAGPQELPMSSRGPWRWFPLGWVWSQGVHFENPGWIPTLALASALGIVAIGIAMRFGRSRPVGHRESIELPSENRLVP